MKKILFIILLGLLTSTIGATEIKLTSFRSISIGDILDHPLAELCGKVSHHSQYPAFVKIIADPNSRNPGIYNTLTDDQGAFCLTLVTYRGSVDVMLIGNQNSVRFSK
jgi:hypothetical protein